MLGTGGSADIDEGALPPPTYEGHRDHNGGGKPPPPKVTPVRYSGALKGPEQAAYFHLLVCQGAEMKRQRLVEEETR